MTPEKDRAEGRAGPIRRRGEGRPFASLPENLRREYRWVISPIPPASCLFPMRKAHQWIEGRHAFIGMHSGSE